MYMEATPEETKRSLERAREAYLSVRKMPAPRRGELIRQIRVALAEKVRVDRLHFICL